ncbi:MAG: hypothetical protein WBO55_15670 [Rhizobiaceae bacterium]
MMETVNKPRLTAYQDLVVLVAELRKLGVTGTEVYQRITEIGAVDLDLLNAVMIAFRELELTSAESVAA